MAKNAQTGMDPEIIAFGEVDAALRGLPPEVQARVIGYAIKKLGIIATSTVNQRELIDTDGTETGGATAYEDFHESNGDNTEDLGGVSPVAKRWMKRNDLTTKALSNIFSLGVDEIDLIAKAVPGKNKKDRMHSVFLLKGVAAYLGTGAARFTHEQVKEACLHYDAYDATNFATYLKSLTREVSGSKDTGYTLTAVGLSSATQMVQKLMQNSGVSAEE